MSLRAEHELHNRRRGRNLGVGLMLGGFVVLIMLLTFAKITETDFARGLGTSTSVAGEGN